MANLGPMMPGLAASTASRVDSSSKHIVACRVGEHYMLEWCDATDNNKRRELHVNKHKYCVFKNELVLNVTRPLFPLDSMSQYHETKAYPSVVTTLADMDDISKSWLKMTYSKSMTASQWYSGINETVQWLGKTPEEKKAQLESQDFLPYITGATGALTEQQVQVAAQHIKNMPYFAAQGYALGTAWASQQTGDTVASVLIGGMQTVMNGAFACAAGDVLQWYFDFEEDQFAHRTQKVNGSFVVMEGQRVVIVGGDPIPHPKDMEAEGPHAAKKRRRGFAERQDGVFNDGSKRGQGMKAGCYWPAKNAEKAITEWKSNGCGKAFPKPYRLALVTGGEDEQQIEYSDHYGDRIRIFAKCISSARPHEMVDVMLLTQSL